MRDNFIIARIANHHSGANYTVLQWDSMSRCYVMFAGKTLYTHQQATELLRGANENLARLQTAVQKSLDKMEKK